MATEVRRQALRWGVVMAVALGVTLGAVLSERIEERTATRNEERARARTSQPIPPPPLDCIDGLNCYCDCIQNDWLAGAVNTANDISVGLTVYANADCQGRGTPLDPNVIACLDFEQQTLHDDLVVDQEYFNDQGQPIGRPVWSDNGFANWRGYGGAWSTMLNDVTVSGGCAWNDQQPTGTVLRGNRCDVGGRCSAAVQSLDPVIQAAWQTDQKLSGGSCFAIGQSDEIANEITDIQPLTNGRRVDSSVFDGNQMLVHRLAAGVTNAFAGDVAINGAVEVGISWAMAYPSNLDRSGVLNRPWKPNEFRGESGGSRANNLFTGCGSGCPTDGFATTIFPMVNYIWYAGGCSGKLLGTNVGGCNCGTSALICRPAFADYDWDRDWGLSEWGCIRGHIDGLDTTSSRWRMWFNDTLILDVTINPVGSDQQNGIFQMKFNSYANANQDPPGEETTETTFRYEDNIHITNGQPYTCSQVGFN